MLDNLGKIHGKWVRVEWKRGENECSVNIILKTFRKWETTSGKIIIIMRKLYFYKLKSDINKYIYVSLLEIKNLLKIEMEEINKTIKNINYNDIYENVKQYIINLNNVNVYKEDYKNEGIILKEGEILKQSKIQYIQVSNLGNVYLILSPINTNNNLIDSDDEESSDDDSCE